MKPKMSSAEVEIWRELVRDRCGLHFTDARLYFMEQRLWERMQNLDMRSYTDYYRHVTWNANGEKEWLTLRDKLLNNESSFLRHKPSYEALIHKALPDLMARKRREGKNSFMMWSAGCSGGQEAYSLGMAALERLDPVVWHINVLGTDISNSQLLKAQGGRYKEYEVRYMLPYYRDKYMRSSPNGRGNIYSVIPPVKKLVRFGTLNLHDSKNYWVVGQDVIFCQNVLIYFQLQDRVRIVQQLAQRLNPGGYLFLGPAEVVGLHLEGLKLLRWKDVLVYQKRD